MGIASRWLLTAGLSVVLALPPTVGYGQDAGTQTPEYPAASSPGRVNLSVRPTWRAAGLVVQITANTHSVNLAGIDLAKAVRLRVGGKELAPSSATNLAGHHARGTVTFVVSERPTRFDIVIRGVPDQPERVLSWPEKTESSEKLDPQEGR